MTNSKSHKVFKYLNELILTLVPHSHSWVEVPCCSRSTGTRLSVYPAPPEPSPAAVQSATEGALSAAAAAPHWELQTPQHTLAIALEGYHLPPYTQTHHEC